MPRITLFSAPKPFRDSHIAVIQWNAIKSWTLLPDVEVILLGEEAGLAEAAQELGVKHIPKVARNQSGTPLISSMLELTRVNGSGDLLCIINADMILMPDFVEAALESDGLLSVAQKQVSPRRHAEGPASGGGDASGLHRYVLLSQRWDLDITTRLDFVPGWQRQLESTVRTRGQLHRPAGSDFFLFPRSCYQEIPDFAIGRAGWDNWMIYQARKEKWPVIDCTPSVMIVHQNHDYSHLPGGRSHHEHPDTSENIRLAGGQAAIRYTVLDATHQLRDGKLARPKLSYPRFLRRVELLLRKMFFFLPENTVESIARPKRWKKRIQKTFGKR